MARPVKFAQADLVSWIKARIANDPEPIEFEGHTWLALDQAADAATLGISDRKLRDMIKQPPIVKRRTTYADFVPVVLVRIGEPEPDNERLVARKMAGAFRTLTKRDVRPSDFGCLMGLAEIWPDGKQVEIFKCAIYNWSEFMSCVQCADIDAGVPEDHPYSARYYKYPVVALIRKYPQVAVDLYQLCK